ncbi:MAG: helix-turn-helix transcriptional regulator [Bryobacteraceae bacterium]|jgi:transcriptional regulator with XRE-family HTH domain
MRLGIKIRTLRHIEGTLRGFDRALTQQEVVLLIGREMGRAISQSYLSQIESGTRPHLTNATRLLLSSFFKVHPGYLVDDPEGFSTGLVSAVATAEDTLDDWLAGGAERFQRDPELAEALLKISRHEKPRTCLVLLGRILDNPGLAERLLEVFPPAEERRRP